MHKARTFMKVLAAAALVAAVCSALAAAPANAARDYRPSDDGEPTGTSSDPLESSESVQIIVRGLGTIQGSGFNCTRTCSRSYKKGQWIALTAQEGNGYQFSGWQRACGRAPQSHSCGFKAGDAHVVYAVFVPLPPVTAPALTPPVSVGAPTLVPTVPVSAPTLKTTVGVKDGRTKRKVEVQFDVGASSVVTYELRQNGDVVQSWQSSPFTGRSTRTIWIDDRVSAGTYELGLRIVTGTQVRSFHGPVVLPPPRP
ncbi:MAG: hypothetical protein E6G08_20610 [Actinobacteria bacterium]|nr:MAG: hypothetical protein E6G08_20610 [Actinomycetota bacterium]